MAMGDESRGSTPHGVTAEEPDDAKAAAMSASQPPDGSWPKVRRGWPPRPLSG